MRNYKSFELESKRYDECIKTLQSNKKSFQEHLYGSRRKIILNNKVRATSSATGNLNIGDLTNEKFVSFLALFSKHLYKRLIKYPYLYQYKINFIGVARSKNYKFWSTLKENTLFYNIDLKSAYWQIAKQLGYIDDDFFNRYMFNDDYKQAKRYCISFLARRNRVFYHEKGKVHDIECDITSLKTCYNNIRHQLYSCISKAVSLCNNVIEFNIDGIYVMADEVDIVRKAFDEMNLIYKITKCVKVNENQYKYDYQIRNYKTIRV
jgi:hypothetical protein